MSTVRVSPRIAEAMGRVHRSWFLPRAVVGSAHQDVPLPIGHKATCSQPTTVAHLLAHLDANPGDRVLDVGAGSGWTTALLAHLTARPAGQPSVETGGSVSQVLGVELEPELVTFGRANLAVAGSNGVDVSRARIEQAEAGVLGWPRAAPYRRILVSAEASEVPAELVAQLTDDGRMVIPVRRRLVVVDRDGQSVRTRDVGEYRFVPLR